MRKIIILAVIAAQVAVLAFMAGEREWLLRTGQTVLLRTAPIDPQDPMRGDYVRLNYEIATVPKTLCRDGTLAWFQVDKSGANTTPRDQRVYAAIKLDRDGVAEVVSLSDQRPAGGLFLRGRSESIYANAIGVRFGVEALFMQQGKARAFEDMIRTEKAGVPLNMEIAVNSRGLSTIRSYRWEPLGITLTLDRAPAPTPAQNAQRVPRPGLRGVTVELKNHSDAAVGIVDSGSTHCFRLIGSRDPWQLNDPINWRWTRESDPRATPRADDIIVLKPGESHRVHLDFTAPEWLVQKHDEHHSIGEPTSLEALGEDWNAAFRIEYAPPPAELTKGLPQAELIRHATLRSRRFNAAGGGD